MMDECGRHLPEPAKVVATWFRHFSGVLNVTSQFCQEFIDRSPSLETRTNFDAPPYNGVFKRFE